MNDIENQSTEPKKRGRKKGSSLGRPPAPAKTKSKRIPVELLEIVDKLLMIHKQHSTDGRVNSRVPGEYQRRVSNKTEIRQIPLEYWELVASMVEKHRAEHGMARTRRAKS